jgi:hypothetical protein
LGNRAAPRWSGDEHGNFRCPRRGGLPGWRDQLLLSEGEPPMTAEAIRPAAVGIDKLMSECRALTNLE